MGLEVWIAADTLDYPTGAGHLWSYLNWALGLSAVDCEVVWMERWRAVPDRADAGRADAGRAALTTLVDRLSHAGIEQLCLFGDAGEDAPGVDQPARRSVEEAGDAALLLNLAYELPAQLLRRFARTALLDIDPGMTQAWAAAGELKLAAHDVYLTAGEGIANGTARVPTGEVKWHYLPPCVALDAWSVTELGSGTPYSTVTHWWGDGSFALPDGRVIDNSKRAGFLPYVSLPRHAGVALELAVARDDLEADADLLLSNGWSLADPVEVAGEPDRYQRYVESSRGEFSAAKPAYVELASGWISDRTVCYLASGRPAIVQHTGPCSKLDDVEGQGVFRFSDLDGAASALRSAERDHARQRKLARELAEDRFDARRAATRLLELSLA